MRITTHAALLLCAGSILACDIDQTQPTSASDDLQPKGSTTAAADVDALTLDELVAEYNQIADDILSTPISGPDVQQSATGRADLEVYHEVKGFRYSYSFSAVRHQDGTTSGRFVNIFITPDGQPSIIQGDVTCLAAAPGVPGPGGATAGMTGVVTSTHPNFHGVGPGGDVSWDVLDNGDGSESPPDLASHMFYGFGTPPNVCFPQFGFGYFETDNGNIQVRP